MKIQVLKPKKYRKMLGRIEHFLETHPDKWRVHLAAKQMNIREVDFIYYIRQSRKFKLVQELDTPYGTVKTPLSNAAIKRKLQLRY